MTSDITRIRIGGQDTGIIGLTEILAEVVGIAGGLSDQELGEALLARVGSRNYIPPSARDKYARALLREYKKFAGLSVEEESDAGPPEILVVGPGCARCDGLEKLVMEVLTEIGLPARLEHVREAEDIARMGIVGVPALVINGKVKCAGSVPSKGTIKAWLVALKLG